MVSATVVSDMDSHHMASALMQARAAFSLGEVPVGAVVVRDGVVIGTGFNMMICSNDPTAHAEIVAIRAAASRIGNYRLEGCDLYVTLEPCAMCAGAILHSRIRRVVFGAVDPKTGAAGSVIDTFSNMKLNHQTSVLGGVRKEECSELLKSFFKMRRIVRRQESAANHPLRDDALRTPDQCFEPFTDDRFTSHYISHLSSLSGLRMHYLDEGPPEAKHVVLMIHSNGMWGYGFQRMLPALISEGFRVVIPDLIGFGRSDKPKRPSAHSLEFHNQVLVELLQHLNVHLLIAVLQNGRCAVGWSLASLLPSTKIDSFVYGLPEGPLWRAVEEWQHAPFPNNGYKAALEVFDDFLLPDVPPAGMKAKAVVMPDEVLVSEERGVAFARYLRQLFPTN